jgi:hypothetical protein
LFEDTGGLFGKAERFVKSQEQKTAKKEGEITIIPAVAPKKPAKRVANPDETVYGFEDLDGDGDPIMDDAIIEK